MRHHQISHLFRPFVLLFILFSLVGSGAEATPPPPPTLPPQAALGKQVFSRECATCHSLSKEAIIVGPSLAGIAKRAGQRVPNTSAEAYLLQSIMRPDAYMVEGFENLMPTNLGKKLTGEEVDGVVAYLLTIE